MTTTIQQTLSSTKEQLNTTSETPQADSEILLCHVLDCNRTYLHTWPEKILTQTQQQRLEALIERRKQGEPVAYLTGQRAFWEFDLAVSAATLIPRPETELLVEQALLLIPMNESYDILDLGTGTGAIALAIAHERPASHITAIEQSTEALSIAAQNIKAYSSGNIQLLDSHWFSALGDKTYHIIVSNPPYIAVHDPHLNAGDVRHEPRSALVSGEDGLDDIRHIIEHSIHHLHAGGHLLLEHGYDQSVVVKELLLLHGFKKISQYKDLSGHLRVSHGQRG